MKNLDSLKKVLEGKTTFLLVAHENPDGDALGAILSLGQFLDDMGKTVHLATKDPVPQLFRFLNGAERVVGDFLIGDYEVIILVDNGDLKRTGFAERILAASLRGKTIINIDHHPQNDIWKLATINIAEADYSSASEIIYDIFQEFKYVISPSVATNLLAGIYYDTGGFLHANTNDKVMRISADLLMRGASLKKVSTSVHQSKSIAMLKLWGMALARLKVLPNGLAFSFITDEDIQSSGASEEEISGLVGMINTTAEAEAGLLIYQSQDGKIRGSLRTESDKIDVARLAKQFGGGGHRRAAGFSLRGRLVYKDQVWRVE